MRLVAYCALCLALPASAEIVVGGDPAFSAAVQRCLDEFTEAGDVPAEIRKQLNQPKPHAHSHLIQPTASYPNPPPNGRIENDASATDADAEHYRPDGTPGAGSDSTVHWNPNDNAPHPDGTPRDPCVSLLHELQHAADIDKGEIDQRTDPGTGMRNDQTHAIDTENGLRKKKGMKQRERDDGIKVPERAIHR